MSSYVLRGMSTTPYFLFKQFSSKSLKMDDDHIYKVDVNPSLKGPERETIIHTKELIENISSEIASLSQLIIDDDDEISLFNCSCRILSLLRQLPISQHMSKQDQKQHFAPINLPDLIPLFNQECIMSFFKVLQIITTAHRASEPLFCLSYALFFNKSVKELCLDQSFFEHLSALFEEATTFPDDNWQARVMMPIADICMKCCDSEEEAKLILSSGVFTHVITFLTEIVSDNLIIDNDPSVETFAEVNERTQWIFVSTILFYYHLFDKETVALLLDLAKQSIQHKHKTSLSIACELITRFYICVPEAFPMIVTEDPKQNVFFMMNEIIEIEAEEEYPSGFDISCIFKTLRYVLEKAPKLQLIDDLQESCNQNEEEKQKEKETPNFNEEEKWKNHYSFAHHLSKMIDPDLIFKYVYDRRSIISSEKNCEEANQALLLLAKKMLLDEEVSTDIEVHNIFEMIEVIAQDGGYQSKEAFTSFLFAYIQYAPDFLLQELFSTTAVCDLLEAVSGCDMKCLPIILDAFIRIVEVFGLEWMQDENYVSLIDHIHVFIEQTERIYPLLEWKFDIIQSYFQSKS